MICCTTGSADASLVWACGSTAVRSGRVGMVRTGVLPGAVFCKPYRAASASLTGIPVGVTPADFIPGAGVIGTGTIPGTGRPPGVGNTPGMPCGINGFPGIAAIVGVGYPFSLNVSTAGMPPFTILTAFSLSSISNTWMSP